MSIPLGLRVGSVRIPLRKDLRSYPLVRPEVLLPGTTPGPYESARGAPLQGPADLRELQSRTVSQGTVCSGGTCDDVGTCVPDSQGGGGSAPGGAGAGAGGMGGAGGREIPVAVDVTSGRDHACARISDGRLFCWGSGSDGQLGNGQQVDLPVPEPVPLEPVEAVEAGGGHTCAISEGTVWCWGLGTDGLLGNGSVANASTPQEVPGLAAAATISANFCVAPFDYGVSCTSLDDETASCWGSNSYSQLGDGSTNASSTPVSVQLGNVAQVSSGGYWTCARLSNGGASCWGANTGGQLGDGTTTDSAAPVSVGGGNNKVHISAGNNHTCAILSDMTAACWGADNFGQIGDGSAGSGALLPAPVAALTGVADLSAGRDFTCAVLNDGSVRCWGRNEAGQLGVGAKDGDSHPTPLQVNGLAQATKVDAGGDFACAVTEDGRVFCWGGQFVWAARYTQYDRGVAAR